MEERRLRKANENDCDLLYRFRNDPLVREMSFHTEEIHYTVHQEFFEKLLADRDRRQYVLEVEGEPAGQIRVKAAEDPVTGTRTALEISYSVDRAFRRRGLGTWLWREIVQTAKEDFPETSVFLGSVKPENQASNRAFLRAGYEALRTDEEKTLYQYRVDAIK